MRVKTTTISKWFSDHGYEKIEPMDYFRFMFPSGELVENVKNPRAPEVNAEWKYNGIILERTHKTSTWTKKMPDGSVRKQEKEIWRSLIVCDDLSKVEACINRYGKTSSEFYMSPHSYIGRKRTARNERWTYACIVEVDHPKTKMENGHRVQEGVIQLLWDWKTIHKYLPPSAVVCSGSGVHLVYFLDRPYCIRSDRQKQQWDNFRSKFVKEVWTDFVTKAPIQNENHCQSFRMPGTRTKKGQLTEAFWIEKERRYTLQELFSQVEQDAPLEYDESVPFETMAERFMDAYYSAVYEPDMEMLMHKPEHMPKGERHLSVKMMAAKEAWPEWYEDRVVKKLPARKPGQWKTPVKTYEWYLRTAKIGAFEGCRYHRMHGLAEFAVKAGIPYDRYVKDAEELYEALRSVKASEPFRRVEYLKARDEYFKEIARRSTRKWFEEKARIPMKPPAKRNGNKRKDHLHAKYLIDKDTGRRRINECKANREIVLEDMRAAGEITGRPKKADEVKSWRAAHPEGSKAACIKETGLSKPTVYKWWNSEA